MTYSKTNLGVPYRMGDCITYATFFPIGNYLSNTDNNVSVSNHFLGYERNIWKLIIDNLHMISRSSHQEISKLQNKINTRLLQRSWYKHISFLLKRF